MFESREKKRKVIQLSLFVITVLTTTIAGAEWMTGKSILYGEATINITELLNGLQFSIPFLGILTVHEFGHYFVAQYHRVKVTLPYYIPLWLGFIGGPSIGTMGAVIRIQEHINSRVKYFDIGVAGPLAGFVVALVVLTYGFTNLPTLEYIFNIHPEYRQWGADYHLYAYQDKDMIGITLGPNLLFWFFENFVVSDGSLMPHPNEIIHYPYLLAGYLALFFTALNLLPIGQLDGGHILYGLVGGEKHKKISGALFFAFVFYAGLGVVKPFMLSEFLITEVCYFIFLYYCFYKFTPHKQNRLLYATVIFAGQMATSFIFPQAEGYSGWLLFAFVLGRFLGVYHPPVLYDQPLDIKRKVLGWVSLIVFVLCFSPQPFIIEDSYTNENKSETPTFLSTVNPSPYCTRIDIPSSMARASSSFINSGEEISVLEASPAGSKNWDLNALTASMRFSQ